MKNAKTSTILISTIIILAIVPVISLIHAIGQLYISHTTQGPFAKGTMFTYQVKVANIDPFNGWDISVKTDPSVISPTSISVTGNMLAVNFSSTVNELINCVNNSGTNCTSNDGAGPPHARETVQGPVPRRTPTRYRSP